MHQRFTWVHRQRIMDPARSNRLLAVYGVREYVDHGLRRRPDKILRGAGDPAVTVATGGPDHRVMTHQSGGYGDGEAPGSGARGAGRARAYRAEQGSLQHLPQ
jgi:hypothetical protein